MNRIVNLFCGVLVLSAGAQSQIQPQFFAMSVSTTADMPKVSYGVISHLPVVWTTVEGTSRGTYNFSSIDAFVKKAPKNASGAALVNLDLGGWTPEWAVANHSTCYNNAQKIPVCTIPPDNIQDWINFVITVMNHYNGVTAPHVAYYEIWNEASNTKFWTGTIAQMLALAQAAYPIVKQDPMPPC